MPIPTDLALMLLIKNEYDKKAELELFQRYTPFVVKYWKKLCFRLSGYSKPVSFEDFSQEVYITAYQKTIQYFNPEKVKDDSWKIVKIFGCFVKNLINKYVCKHQRDPVSLSSSYLNFDNIKDNNFTSSMISEFEDVRSNRVSFILEQITLNSFIESLSPRHKKLLRIREKSVRTTGRVSTYKALSEKFGLCKAQLHTDVKELYRQYKEYSFS